MREALSRSMLDGKQIRRRPVWQRPFLSRVGANLRKTLRDAVNAKVLVSLVVFAIVGILVYREDRERLLLEPFSVPKALEERGITPAYVTDGIFAELRSMEERIETGARKDTILLSADEAAVPDIEIPATGFSLRAAVGIARRLLRREPARLRGEIVTFPSATEVEISFRVSGLGRRSKSGVVRVASSDPHEMVQSPARAILKAINPYLFCAYLLGTVKDVEAAGTAAQELVRQGEDGSAVAAGYRLWANALMEQGKLDEAVRRYNNALQIEPRDALAFNNLGIALKRQKRFPDAMMAFRKAIEAAPRLALPHYNLADLLRQQSRQKEAEREYRAAVKIDPLLADAWNAWGVMLVQEGRLDEAAGKYETAIGKDPRFAAAHYNLGNLRNRQRRFLEAALEYETAAFLNPDLGAAWVAWGVVSETQNDLCSALDHYRNAVRVQPRSAQAFVNLGNVLNKLRRTNEATAAYRKAIEIDPALDDARQGLANLLAGGEAAGASTRTERCDAQ